jgi:hypothetical protein
MNTRSVSEEPSQLFAEKVHSYAHSDQLLMMFRAKKLKFCAYTLHFLRIASKSHDSIKQFALEMRSRIEEDEIYLDILCLFDEAMFHVRGTVNRHNCHVWGSVNPHDVTEHESDSPKSMCGAF